MIDIRNIGLKKDLVSQLQLDLELQTKMESWKEHYYDQRWSYRTCKKSIEWMLCKVEREKERERKMMEEEGPNERGDFWDRRATAESDLRFREDRLRQMNEYLKWMECQLPIIASECAVSNNVSQAVGTLNRNISVALE